MVIKTIKSSGGDYSSLSAWEAGRQADLSESEAAECYEFEDTAAVTIDGWTTYADKYIYIYTPTAERHDGTCGFATGYRRSGGILNKEEYVRIEGIAAKVTNTSWDQAPFFFGYGITGTGEIRISHCVAEVTNVGSINVACYGCYSCSGTLTVKIWNCIGLSHTASQYVGPFFKGSSTNNMTAYIYNCTGINDNASSQGTAFTMYDTGSGYLKNCLGSTSGGIAFYGYWDQADNCASNDATADDFGGSNNRTGQTFTFVDEDGGDFHLASNDAGALGYGVNLYNDAVIAFQDDIDGDDRGGSGATWDIGADEYTTTTSTSTTTTTTTTSTSTTTTTTTTSTSTTTTTSSTTTTTSTSTTTTTTTSTTSSTTTTTSTSTTSTSTTSTTSTSTTSTSTTSTSTTSTTTPHPVAVKLWWKYWSS